MRLDDDLKYFEEPEFKEILAQYETSRETGKPIYMDAEELTDVAEYYALVLQDNDLANEAIELALQLHPNAVDPQIFKARQFMLNDEPERALSLCDAIEDQSHREVLFLRAELLIRDKKSDEAMGYLLKASYNVEEDVDFFLYDSAYIFIDYQEYECALVLANKLEQMSPEWYKTWQLQADISLGMGNNNLAKRYIKRMLDVDPFSIESWNWNAEAHSNLGEYTQAIDATDYALAVEPDNERALQLKAWVLLQQGNCSEAHELYQRLESLNPLCENHWLYDSFALFDMGQTEQAFTAIKQADELAEPDSEDKLAIYEQMAQVMSRKGMVEEALQYLGKAESIAPEKGTAWDERLLRVRVFAENERLYDALHVIHVLMDKNPDRSAEIYFQGATILFDYSYFDAVVAMLTELEDLTDTVNPDVYAFLAYSQAMLRNHEQALINIRKAVDAGAPSLADVFSDMFPNVKVEELYDYYYYQVYGSWPNN